MILNIATAGSLQSGSDFKSTFMRLCNISSYEAIGGSETASMTSRDVEIAYDKPIDLAAEHARLTKDLAQQEKEFANNQRQLGNENFLSKAPAHVVEGLRTRAAELTALLEKNRASLAALEGDRS